MNFVRPLLALVFLAIATYVGHRLCRALVPGLDGARLPVERQVVAPWVISIPAAFLSGTLLMTWVAYIIAWFAKDTAAPMATANAVVISVALVALGVIRIRRQSNGRSRAAPKGNDLDTETTETAEETPSRIERRDDGTAKRPRRPWVDIGVAATGLVLGTVLMFHTARLDGDTLILGRTAFGDLNIHLGMARSFSAGNNFPTGYVAYAGTDVRYHFMFYFLVGNLEYLGLPIDWALNLPSILSFASVLLLLHAAGSVIGRDARVGALAVLFFLLRSSPAAFFYFAQLEPAGFVGRIAEVLRTNRFIGLTGHEEWGIWNLNVYVVERHFAFAFGLLLIGILYLVRTTGLDAGPPLLRRLRGEARTPASSPDRTPGETAS